MSRTDRSSSLLVGSLMVLASLVGGGLGVFMISTSAYRRARFEGILDEPSRIFDSSWMLQGGALLLLLLGLVGLAMVVFGIRDRSSAER